MAHTKISRRTMLMAAAGAALHAPGRSAEVGNPEDVIRVLSFFQAGAGTDVVLRLALDSVSDSIGKKLIVDNRPGADGILAANIMLNRPADGSTILCVPGTTISGVAALKRAPPYDSRTAFAGISLMGFYAVYLFVSKDAPFATVDQLLQYARSHPGELSIGYSGFIARITAAKLLQLGGLQMTEVPYKGEQALSGDLVTNRVQLAFASPSTLMPYVKDGKLRALATVMPERTKAEPGIPTMSELGVAGFDGAGWVGLFGAKGFPEPARSRLSEAFASALAQPKLSSLAEKIGLSIKSTTPAETDRFVAQDIASTVVAARKADIPLE